MRIPTEEECFKMMEERNLPKNIIAHSKSVCRVALDVADKRVVRDKIVSLEERFKYLKQRYGTEDRLYNYAMSIEKELLG